jgi:glutamate dehydrogenase
MMTYLEMHDMQVGRAHLDVVEDDAEEGGSVAMIRLLVQKNGTASNKETDWERVRQDICRLKWLDDEELTMAKAMMEVNDSAQQEVPLLKAETVQALSHMIYGVLNKVNPYAFSKTRISEMLLQPVNLNVAKDIASLFVDKFDPDARDGATIEHSVYAGRAEAILETIQTRVEYDDAQLLLTTLLDAVSSSLRTNAFCADRFALAIKVDPTLCGVNEVVGTDQPFGTLFVHGRRFNGFHVRFRDIARGGLRVVVPPSKEQHVVESARQYDEVYSLAFAQQLKNKDIPEGGSKAVVLVDPATQGTRQEEVSGDFRGYLMRKSVKAFTDSVLDLVTIDPAIKARIVDYYKKDELIYLGPDENVIPEDINWIIDRAGKRGYPIPAAFMSSKPDAGINHKVYGVTSEGVAVFLDTALKAQGKHPDDTGTRNTVNAVSTTCPTT